MDEKPVLSVQDILDKDFKIDTRGYRLKEVDQFLDMVIGDYEIYDHKILELEKEREALQSEIMNLKRELRNVRMSIDIAKTGENKEVTNVDLMRRVSNLEKIVYGNPSSRSEKRSVEVGHDEETEESEEEEE